MTIPQTAIYLGIGVVFAVLVVLSHMLSSSRKRGDKWGQAFADAFPYVMGTAVVSALVGAAVLAPFVNTSDTGLPDPYPKPTSNPANLTEAAEWCPEKVVEQFPFDQRPVSVVVETTEVEMRPSAGREARTLRGFALAAGMDSVKRPFVCTVMTHGDGSFGYLIGVEPLPTEVSDPK